MNWTENEALAVLVISYDAKHLYTTHERLCYHLVHDHNYPDWIVSGRAQVELETMHNSAHESDKFSHGKEHKHDRPVQICGYEVKERKPEREFMKVIGHKPKTRDHQPTFTIRGIKRGQLATILIHARESLKQELGEASDPTGYNARMLAKVEEIYQYTNADEMARSNPLEIDD